LKENAKIQDLTPFAHMEAPILTFPEAYSGFFQTIPECMSRIDGFAKTRSAAAG